mmetsp:Transcript_32652/g.37019  ORF Transcript_32652/g.37019 Transcript_32652/m.37019 type:complete len:200 (-) Transcript_32652:526-1125(-)
MGESGLCSNCYNKRGTLFCLSDYQIMCNSCAGQSHAWHPLQWRDFESLTHKRRILLKDFLDILLCLGKKFVEFQSNELQRGREFALKQQCSSSEMELLLEKIVEHTQIIHKQLEIPLWDRIEDLHILLQHSDDARVRAEIIRASEKENLNQQIPRLKVFVKYAEEIYRPSLRELLSKVRLELKYRSELRHGKATELCEI